MSYLKELVESFCGCLPSESFSGSGIERQSYRLEGIGIVQAEIGTLWKILAQKSVGVLIGAALPWAVRITKIDVQARVDLQACVLSKLGSLIPGQGPTQLPGQGDDRASDSVAHRLSPCPARAGPFFV